MTWSLTSCAAMPEPDDHYYVSGYTLEDDPYVEANGVLKNLLGLTSTAELLPVEDAIVTLRTAELGESPVLGNFDLPHLQAIHRRLFGQVYAWAGELRCVDIGKGNTAFQKNGLIVQEADALFAELAAEQHLRGLDGKAFCDRAGEYLGRLNYIHPFREGNGRSQREFFRLLANQAGFDIDWSGCSPQAMITACIEALDQDYRRLSKLMWIGLQTYPPLSGTSDGDVS